MHPRLPSQYQLLKMVEVCTHICSYHCITVGLCIQTLLALGDVTCAVLAPLTAGLNELVLCWFAHCLQQQLIECRQAGLQVLIDTGQGEGRCPCLHPACFTVSAVYQPVLNLSRQLN